MIQLLDYINDLEIEAQRKKEKESGSKKVNKARSNVWKDKELYKLWAL